MTTLKRVEENLPVLPIKNPDRLFNHGFITSSVWLKPRGVRLSDATKALLLAATLLFSSAISCIFSIFFYKIQLLLLKKAFRILILKQDIQEKGGNAIYAFFDAFY